MNNQDELAEVIILPTMMNVSFKCHVCLCAGQGLIYKIRLNSLLNAKIFCESCKHLNKDSINIDLTNAQELLGVPVFPTGVIEWESPKQMKK